MDKPTEYILCLVPIGPDAEAASVTLQGIGGYITVIQSKHRPLTGSPEEIEEALDNGEGEDGSTADIINFKPRGRPN